MKNIMRSVKLIITLLVPIAGLMLAFVPQITSSGSGAVGTECDDFQAHYGNESNENVYQFGLMGDDIQFASLAGGNDRIKQYGETGDDEMKINAGEGDDIVFQYGKEGNDTMMVDGSLGNDKIRLEGGYGVDSITCNVSDGDDQIEIDGGQDVDSITINSLSSHNFTVYDAEGNIIFKQGKGGTVIIIYDPENLFVQSDGMVQVYP